MSLTFNKVRLEPSEDHSDNIEIHFNLMDYKNYKLKIASSTDSNFGLFEVVKS